MKPRALLLAPIAIILIAGVIFVAGTAVRLLWNWLLPPLFGWHEVTFWQAFGLLALCRILFGGFSSHGFSRSSGRRRIAEKMAGRMDDDERARFRQRMRARFGFDPSPEGRTEL